MFEPRISRNPGHSRLKLFRRLLLIQLQRDGIDAVTQAGRTRPVGKYVPKVSAALAADDLRSGHSVACVFFSLDTFVLDGFIEARPARAGIIFCIRIEQFIPTCCTLVYARVFCLVVFAGKRTLRSFHSADFVLLGSEYFFPFLVGFFDFVLHQAIVLQSFERRLPVGGGGSPKGHGAGQSRTPTVQSGGCNGPGSVATEEREIRKEDGPLGAAL